MHTGLFSVLSLFSLTNLALGAAFDGVIAPYSRFAHIRPLDQKCSSLLSRGADSPTFRNLVSHIERSDIIVYVDYGRTLRPGVVGATRLIARGGTYRYVRVSIDPRVDGDAAVAVLGHELYHVTELAAAPHVVDPSGVRELYMRLGHQTCAEEPPCFDTRGARRAGELILRELRNRAGR